MHSPRLSRLSMLLYNGVDKFGSKELTNERPKNIYLQFKQGKSYSISDFEQQLKGEKLDKKKKCCSRLYLVLLSLLLRTYIQCVSLDSTGFVSLS